MKANKVTVTITVELLSIDALGGIIWKAIDHIGNEHEEGKLIANDGDMVTWETKREEVQF